LTPRTLVGFEGESEAGERAVFASVQIAVDSSFSLCWSTLERTRKTIPHLLMFHVIIASILLSRRATFFHAPSVSC